MDPLAAFTAWAAVAASVATTALPPAQRTVASYRAAVAEVCDHPLLFSGRHEIGTRAGAVAVSRDIRLTGNGRLRRVDAIPKPRGGAILATRWIVVERRLVSTYARTYLRIWEAIDGTRTAEERARLPRELHRLVHAPDALAARAGALEARLRLPDCTGGTVPAFVP